MSENAAHVRLFVSVDGGAPWEPDGLPLGSAASHCRRVRDQENRIRVAIDDLVEFLSVMGAD